MIEDPSFCVLALPSVWYFIPRFISGLMMHLTVEPDIRNGISYMKYVVNHPNKFVDQKRSKKEKQPERDNSRILLAFLLGFCQCSIAFMVEFIVIVYLSSQKALTDIIMKFVALAAICKFDDFYAGALYDEKSRDAVGKTLPTEYFREMGFLDENARD